MLDRRLLVVSGKGGVGKSAVAAALALRAARAGKRVLAIAMTDAIGLATHLGAEHLTYQPHEIRPGLSVMVVQRAAGLDEYLRLQIGIPRVTRLGPVMRTFDVLASTAPGIREIVTIGKVIYEFQSGRWDVVVADGPPVGQIGSHLRAPRTIGELVPAGGVQDQAGRMQATLADPATTSLVVVTLAEELPVTETNEALDWLEGQDLVGRLDVVTNRVLPLLDLSDQWLSRLEQGPHRQAAQLHRALFAEQRSWLERLPAGPQLPYLFGLMTPAEVAARLADDLETA